MVRVTHAAALLLAASAVGAMEVSHGYEKMLRSRVEITDATSADDTVRQVPVVDETVKSQFKTDAGVTVAMQCVISLSIQYFVVYTMSALVRTIGEVLQYDYKKFPAKEILMSAELTVNFAPMLAVLFLAVRMRVNWLTQGKGGPPESVQMWMYACTYSVLAATLVVCVIPLFTKEVIGVDPRTGDIDPDTQPFTSPIAMGCFTALKYLIMIGLYVGVVVIIYGTIFFEPPAGTWPGNEIPPVSPAVGCVLILACQYFLVYAALQASKSVVQFTDSETAKRVEAAMMTATNAMNFAPMLAVLFIGARMRALQMDPVNGAPQKWAQNCFYMCTYATLAQTLISIAVPLVLHGEAKTGKAEGDMEYKVDSFPLVGTILTVGRYVIMFCIYIGFTAVIYSVLTIEHPSGPEYTPPISVTMQCVINLTAQFFFVYLMIWIGVSIKEFMKYDDQTPWLTWLTKTMESARGTIQFCPMLAILFVGTRMRALWLTNNRGAPQGWVQDGMYMATWAVLVQFVMVCLVAAVTGKADMDQDGNVKWVPSNQFVLYAVLTLKWLTYIFLYGGIIAVVAGVYMMTPETANGRGSVPLIGDGKVPGVEASVPGYSGVGEPYGPNDIPRTVNTLLR